MARALVTGGTSGIGAAFAAELAAQGWDLVIVARNPIRLAETAALLHADFGIDVEVISADLGLPDDLHTVADRLASEQRPVDLLVNNAGFGVKARLLDPGAVEHEYAISVMIRAVLLLGGTAGSSMSARGRGGIITVGSVAGQLTMSGYSAIKAWVNAYAQGLFNELRGSGVVSTTLLPGWVATEFHQRAGIGTRSIPSFLWLDPRDLARRALRDHRKGRALSIPSARYRFLSWLLQVLPRRTVRWVSWRMSSRRRSDSATIDAAATRQ